MTTYFPQKKITDRPFEKEIEIITSRSSGPGGQHVNKTETKVELRFQIDASELLNQQEKEIIKKKLARRITNEGILIITSQENRSQLMNKEAALKKFYHYLSESLKKRKKRIPTKPTKASVRQRIETKKKVSEKKVSRLKNKPGKALLNE